jgi:glycosyltransferase involved in cell wall biosynthesis
MASGLPAIASDVGGNPEIVQHGVSGLLVPPRDADALARAMIRLIEDPALAERLATQGAERVRCEFSIERMLERMQLTYRRTLAHGVA